MSEAINVGGPVSAALEVELRSRVRQRGIVIWLDLDDNYSGFVDRLAAGRAAGAIPYQVEAFRGSFLELMLRLERAASGREMPRLVIHLPGFNEESVRGTPLLELYVAGVRFRKALGTLVIEAAAGHARPEQIAAFVGEGGLTLEAADAWLDGLLAEPAGGLAAQLRSMRVSAVVDDLLEGGFLASLVPIPESVSAVWSYFAAKSGLTQEWCARVLPPSDLQAEDVAFAVTAWALAVEYVHDLKRAPVDELLKPLVALPQGVIEECRQLAVHLRDRHRGFYQRTAEETESLLSTEIDAARAEDLGRIDTFRFEEERVLEAALAALQTRAWDSAARWAGPRLRGESFWLREDPSRRSAWQLVADAARLGQAIDRAGPRLGAEHGLGSAVERYADLGSAVDQAHRHLEQHRLTLLYPQLPAFETLRSRLDEARLLWREWADAWARDFSALCRTEGFLPPHDLQQRTLFDQVVRPLAQEGTTALFVVDALRYEMADELYRDLADTPATSSFLRARLAELPTVTEVGMNVLPPVASSGALRPAFNGETIQGFSTGEFRVSDPETRRRAMHDRVGGGTSPWMTLEEVVSRDTSSLRRSIAQARLVVVHSQEIDAAGEKGVGPAVFDHVMQKLRGAWRLLREAGIKRFVFTADHGFLLLDEGAGRAQTHGRKIDPHRRHVFSTVAADHSGEVRVALSDLGYEGATGYLMVPETTAVFDTGRRPASFVHGGNSLQERVIPVLSVVHRAAVGGITAQYRVTVEAREAVAGMHCLEAGVAAVAQQELDFGGTRELELGLRVPEDVDVQVELCQARGGARIERGSLVAKVGERFELFFRLSGATTRKVPVELYHPSAVAEVETGVVDTRFAVSPVRRGSESEEAPETGRTIDWLLQLPDGGVRNVFEHLAKFGVVTEAEAATMLGGARGLRRFSSEFETLASKAPFDVRIDVIAGVKRYVREGSQ